MGTAAAVRRWTASSFAGWNGAEGGSEPNVGSTFAVEIPRGGLTAFNNAHGQDAGDSVLAAFAGELSRLDAAAAIRDGGDEFLLVGAPARSALVRDLDSFRHAWPAAFRARFGADVPPVAPRILVTRTRGRDLRAAREVLGRRRSDNLGPFERRH